MLRDWVIFLALGFAIGFVATFPSFDFRLRARGTPAAIVVDASGSGTPIETRWFHSFAQGGEEAKDMLGPVIEKVRALKPTFIRLDHIYDGYGIVSKNASGLTYDWSRLDEALQSIRETGATPVIALSYMPDVLTHDGRIIQAPDVWPEWSAVVQATIEHVSGEKKFSGVYYEVWNEPDLEQFGSWKYYGGKNYLTLYTFAARGASNAKNVQPFFLGGPSTTALYKPWIEAIVHSGARLDFLSWHVYDSRPDKIKEDIQRVRGWFADNPRILSLPVLITEYGFTGNKDQLYNTRYAASYTAAVIRHTADIMPSPLIFSFELKDGPHQEDGWGLLGHESSGAQPKPRYLVFAFLDSLKGDRIPVAGEGTWVSALATREGDKLRIALINVDPNTPGASHTEQVPVTITHINPGTYTVRLRYFSGTESSTEVDVVSTTLTKDIYVQENDLVIVEVTPK